MRADSFAGQVIAVVSRRDTAFRPSHGEPSTFPGQLTTLLSMRVLRLASFATLTVFGASIVGLLIWLAFATSVAFGISVMAGLAGIVFGMYLGLVLLSTMMSFSQMATARRVRRWQGQAARAHADAEHLRRSLNVADDKLES